MSCAVLIFHPTFCRKIKLSNYWVRAHQNFKLTEPQQFKSSTQHSVTLAYSKRCPLFALSKRFTGELFWTLAAWFFVAFYSIFANKFKDVVWQAKIYLVLQLSIICLQILDFYPVLGVVLDGTLFALWMLVNFNPKIWLQS